MKIATWNVMKPTKLSGRNANILREIASVDPDILILTETNSCIDPGEQYRPFRTADLFGTSTRRCNTYKSGENSVTIWTKYHKNAVTHPVESSSSVCVGLDTPIGRLTVYGTVIGIHGRGGEEFNRDLEIQPRDWQRLSKLGYLCIAGDFNTSLEGSYYVSKLGRKRINESFEGLKIEAPTRDIPNNIDHIALSAGLLKGITPSRNTWNEGQDKKKLSDHMGVCLTLESSEQ